MRGRVNLPALCARALSEAMDTRTMTAVVRDILPNYDIHERTGIPESLAIPGQEVARQIVTDVVQDNKLLLFIGKLIDIQEAGLMGRHYQIPQIRAIVQEVIDSGFVFDKENRMFVENPAMRKTRNWGALQTDKEYTIAFLRIDIVKNSQLVRSFSAATIQKAYGALRDIFTTSVERRNGRVWAWEGDGGLAAFVFSDRDQKATLAGMEIIHELHLFNKIANPLPAPLAARIAVHSGPVDYTENDETLKQSSTLNQLKDIEENYTSPSSVTISPVVKVMLDALVAAEFTATRGDNQGPYYSYSLRWEK